MQICSFRLDQHRCLPLKAHSFSILQEGLSRESYAIPDVCLFKKLVPFLEDFMQIYIIHARGRKKATFVIFWPSCHAFVSKFHEIQPA